ncbi:AI-2E family transporter [Atopobacter phocae]|uniref:AI-2E family transporter n=1 Tax=Atopobacter phocae TaxID=136492 RepID=UPI001FDF958A|nr:AI-2E family transporter [Atopobacter phocae]
MTEMEDKQLKKQRTKSMFWYWFLNNKMVAVLLVILLIMINILLLQRISGIFSPIGSFFSIIALPVIMAGVVFYIVNPLYQLLLRKNVKDLYAIWIVFAIIALVFITMFSYLIPMLKTQITDFINSWPNYYDSFVNEINNVLKNDWLLSIQPQLNQMNEKLTANLSQRLNGILNVTVNSIGNIVGVVTETVIGIITMPIVLFYLLRDQDRIVPKTVKVFPTRVRQPIARVLKDMNMQISQYIRGQLTVAFFVAVMFAIGYLIIDLKYGIVIAIFAGIMNIVPYLGSFIGMVPAIVIALVTSPIMLVKVLVVFMIEQTLEGRIISPLVLGSSLKIHPLTILFILLAAGKVFGFAGLLLGIPGYAVGKVLIVSIFEWYKKYSNAYEEDNL